MAVSFYPAIIERAGQSFSIFFPDVPGCGSAGNTIDEAARNAEEALAGHFEVAREVGEPIPQPSSLDQVAVDPDIQEVARILVRWEQPGKAVRLGITMDERLLQKVDRAADALGFTRSGFLAEAARRLIVSESDTFRPLTQAHPSIREPTANAYVAGVPMRKLGKRLSAQALRDAASDAPASQPARKLKIRKAPSRKHD